MASSPTITNLFDDDEQPNDDHYEPNTSRNNVRVVSQSQSTDPFDHLLNAVALRSNEIDSPSIAPPRVPGIDDGPDIKAGYDAYADEGMMAQVPEKDANLIQPSATIVVTSPTKKSLLAAFEAPSTPKKRSGAMVANAMKQKQKKQKICVEPFRHICGFLRESSIESRIKELKKKKTKMTVGNDIKSALTSWSNKHVVSYAPFQSIKEFKDAPSPLMFNDHRLLLEDFMELQTGDEVMCLISKSHPLVSKKKGSLKQVFQETMESDVHQPVQLSRTVYFPLKLVVRSNINYDDFKSGNLEQSEVAERCIKSKGYGVTFWFQKKIDYVDLDDDGRAIHKVKFVPCSHCIFFSNFLDHPRDILFFKRGHDATRMSQVKAYLHNWKDVDHINAAVRVFLDEVYGDPLMTLSLSEWYQHQELQFKARAEMEAYKAAPVSDAKVETRLLLKNEDDAFKSFRNYMDEKCSAAIFNLYGRFSKLSKPVLSQKLLSDLTNRFKVQLRPQHLSISYV